MYSHIIKKAKKKMEEMEPVKNPSEYAMEVMKPKKGESKKEDLIELEMMVKSAKKKK